jgi:hypothetical protein
VRGEVLECGDLSPLSLAATRRGEAQTADESAVEKAATSRRTPKFGCVLPRYIGEADAERAQFGDGYRSSKAVQDEDGASIPIIESEA